MTPKERIAYIAGIIDGEAYVGIKKSTYQQRRGTAVSPMYHERVQVRMNCRDVLEFIKAQFGGSLRTEPRVYQSASGYKGRRIMSVYCATDAMAARLIAAVRPYLIEKTRQADAILGLRASKESPAARKRGSPARRVMSGAVLEERERLYQSARAAHRE